MNYNICFIGLFLVLGSFSGCNQIEAENPKKLKSDVTLFSEALTSEVKITAIKWDDGDSGVINNEYPFSLAKLKAPKIGKIGKAGGANCVEEQSKGLGLKKSFEKMEPEHLKIHRVDGFDKSGRALIYLRYKNTDVGLIGLRAGLLVEWPRRGEEETTENDQPDWCEIDEVVLDRNPDYQWYCFTRLYRGHKAEKKTGIFKVSDKHCLAYQDMYKELCLPLEKNTTYKTRFKCGFPTSHKNFYQLNDVLTRIGSSNSE